MAFISKILKITAYFIITIIQKKFPSLYSKNSMNSGLMSVAVHCFKFHIQKYSFDNSLSVDR